MANLAASRTVLADYVALTKPRVLSLLLLTALCAMFLAARGVPPLGIVVAVLGGGAMAAGGANAVNHGLEADLDGRMARTRRRPVAAGRVSRARALRFGAALNVAAFAILAGLVNLQAALLTLGATLFYVLVYTVALKRRTPQSIVIGGAAGAVPPLVGWVAVTGRVDLAALYLFAIVFFWTPPHFWALSLLMKDDYARAGVPMLPVVTSVATTKRGILLYTVLLVSLAAAFATTRLVGWGYLAVALALGAGYLVLAWRLLRSEGTRLALPVYRYSLIYLAVLFAAIAVDGAVAW